MSASVNDDGVIPSTPNIFTTCQGQLGNTTDQLLLMQCITNQLEQVATQAAKLSVEHNFPRSVLLVYAAALIFFMQAGFAMVCAGAVRKKNVQNTMLKNLLDACGASIAFFAVGYAIAFGGMMSDHPPQGKTFMGTQNFFMHGVTDYAFWLFEYAFSAASTTIVAGTLAERCQMAAYLCYSMMLSGWVYPIIAHAIWSTNGFLSASGEDPLLGVGMVDFAGSGVVHITGGLTALFATMILGPRRGRFHDDTGRKLETPVRFPGHSMALQMLGTFILWFGWYGFNGGSALLGLGSRQANKLAALAATNTTISAGLGGITALMVNLWYLERTTGEAYFDITYAMNGCLAGLVAITGGCGVVEPWAAFVIGTFAGIFYLLGSHALIKLRLDDAVDAIPVHMVCGVWGVIAVGLFASPRHLMDAYGRNDHAGLVYSWRDGSSDATLLGVQLIGILFISGWVMFVMLPFFIWLDWQGWFRSDPLEEIVGLDLSYHGGIPLLHNGGDEPVNPEYITAYRRKKAENRSNKNFHRNETRTELSVRDDEQEDDSDDDDDDEGVEQVRL